jgi:hypothetical protein
MNEPQPRPSVPSWIQGAVIMLLAAQVGMLWMHGSMLERQHTDLRALREDVQDLAESLDDFQGSLDDTGSGDLRPSRNRLHRAHPRIQRVRMEEPDPEEAQRQRVVDQRKAEKEAVAKARDVQEKLSLEANARKADEKAQAEAKAHPSNHLGWFVAAAAVLALLVRAWLRRRN